MKRICIAAGAVVSMLALGRTAHAYPEYIAKGYTTCASCHYNATGGGLPNSYGRAAVEATFKPERLLSALAKHDVSGFDDQGAAAFQWDVGLDARLLFLRAPQRVGGGAELMAIPMLIETGGVLAYGRVLGYGTVTPRRSGPDARPDTIFSREHWVQVRLTDTLGLRAGRLVPPFGLRLPDHTASTREDLGFNKWDQSYGLEADHNSESWTVAAMAMAGDLLLEAPAMQRRGLVASVIRHIPSRASIGGSVLAVMSELFRDTQTSLFLRASLTHGTYLMAELAARHRAQRHSSQSQLQAAGFARIGWFATEWLDVYVEWAGRRVVDAYGLTRQRFMGGVNWHVLPWVELAPAALFEEDVESGPHWSLLAQLHVVY